MLESGPQVLSTGGGAFMNAQTRDAIAAHGLSVWLKADIDMLMERVSKKQNRPLLKTADPRAVLEKLMAERHPVYALADVTVPTRDERKEVIADEVIEAIDRHLSAARDCAGRQRDMTREHRDRRGRARRPGLRHPDRRRPDRPRRRRRLRGGCPASGRRSSPTRTSRPRISLRWSASLEASGDRLDGRSRCRPAKRPRAFEALQQVVDGVLAARLERGDAVIALGGGVIGDLAGFAAGIVRRGMKFVQMPTSLLAQVDSSVGGKTGINSAHGKNLVGVFHQPQLVLADTGVLDTLPAREFRAGYAEVAKYGLIDRPEFFAWLETNWREMFAGGPARDRGDRRILPRQGRRRRPRRIRDRRPRAAQSRPHLRPCAGGRYRL